MAKRAGRPAFEPGEARAVTLRFRARPDEQELYESAAELEGKTLSEWMRDVLTRSAQRRVKAKKRRPSP